ncbi:AraC family transcriptional regulator [Paenibacillus gansuensis]|uniref:AraC family transcriptional regulator n=1 Tax=Paenibacillus gansuensis TaxID=306542 RepID=A0ABW5PB90_9BACL
MIRYTNLPLSEMDDMLLGTQLQCVYMHLAEQKDRWECELHDHEELELGYIFKGTGRYHIDGTDYEAQAGDLFVIPPRVPHYEVHDPGTPFELLFLMVKHHGDAAKELDQWIRQRQGRHWLSPAERVRSSFLEVYGEIMQQRPGYLSVIDAKLTTVYAALARYSAEADPTPKCASSTWFNAERNEQVLGQIEPYIRQYKGGWPSVEEMAQHFFYHPKYLSQLYKSEKGESLSGLLARIRKERVTELLTGSAEPMEEVAATGGFANIQGLYRWFKKETGMTPLQYRNLHLTAEANAVPFEL